MRRSTKGSKQTVQLPSRAVTFSFRGRMSPAPQFDQAMMIVDPLVSIELDTRDALNQRFVPVDEILERVRKKGLGPSGTKHPLAAPVILKPSRHLPHLRKPLETHLIPDALYGIEYLVDGPKRYRFYALECENRGPKRGSTAGYSGQTLKMIAYRTFIKKQSYREAWGIPNLEMILIRKPAGV